MKILVTNADEATELFSVTCVALPMKHPGIVTGDNP